MGQTNGLKEKDEEVMMGRVLQSINRESILSTPRQVHLCNATADSCGSVGISIINKQTAHRTVYSGSLSTWSLQGRAIAWCCALSTVFSRCMGEHQLKCLANCIQNQICKVLSCLGSRKTRTNCKIILFYVEYTFLYY